MAPGEVDAVPHGAASDTPRAGRPSRLIDAAAGLAAAAIVVVVLIQVVGRIAHAPVSWSEELTRAPASGAPAARGVAVTTVSIGSL